MDRATIKNTAMKPLRRVCISCDIRSSITGEKPSLMMLPSQVFMRSSFLGISTSNAEMSAVRTFLASLRDGGKDPNRDAIHKEFPWTKGASVKVLADTIRRALVKPAAHHKEAFAELEKITSSSLSRMNEGLSDEEFMRLISAVRGEARVRVINRKNTSLRDSDYLNIMMELSGHDHDEAMRVLAESGKFTPGVAKVMIGLLYMTGIRPVEAWGVDIMVPRTDLVLSEEAVALIRKSPTAALRMGIMRSVLDEAETLRMTPGQAFRYACSLASAPAVLIVRNAKQENANRFLSYPYRIMILEGMNERDSDLLAAAALFSRSDGKDAARRRIVECVVYLMKSAIAKTGIRKDITPYTFRHSFATRMRETLSDHECAALTGHTAIRTFKGYGEKRGSGSGSGGWAPAPDPERVSLIAEVWSGSDPDPELLEMVMDENPVGDIGETVPDIVSVRIAVPDSAADHAYDLPEPSPFRR